MPDPIQEQIASLRNELCNLQKERMMFHEAVRCIVELTIENRALLSLLSKRPGLQDERNDAKERLKGLKVEIDDCLRNPANPEKLQKIADLLRKLSEHRLPWNDVNPEGPGLRSSSH